MDTVYVVEYDDYLRIAIGEYLQSQGYKVFIFENIYRALTHIQSLNKKPSAIILNLEMENGFILLDKLAKDEVRVPIYLMYRDPRSLPELLSSNIILSNGPLDLNEMERCISKAMSESIKKSGAAHFVD